MLQFYALSILLNVLVGVILIYAKNYSLEDKSLKEPDGGSFDDDELDEGSESSSDAGFLDNVSLRLVAGILSFFVGLIKILSPMDVPLIGDLLPAVAGLAGGFILLYEYYVSASSLDINIPAFLEKVAVSGRRFVGIFCLAAGVLHFLLPRVVFF